MIAVTCPTGRIAGILVPRLLRRGHPVRVLCRSPGHIDNLSALGAEVIRGTLFDPDRLEIFLRDARSTFLVTPLFENPSDEARAGQAIAAAHAGSMVDHLIFLSVLGSEAAPAPSLAAKAEVEQQLADTGRDFTFLHAAFLMENFSLLHNELDNGVLALPAPTDSPFPVVAGSDIAGTALLALARGPIGTERIELTAPQVLTPERIAEVFSEALGHRVRATEVGARDYTRRLEAAGLPRHRAVHLAGLAGHLAEWSGSQPAAENPLAELGGEPTSLEAFARRAAEEWYARL
jgi:uncharacterized protein YbjT (DUF2867 family)